MMRFAAGIHGESANGKTCDRQSYVRSRRHAPERAQTPLEEEARRQLNARNQHRRRRVKGNFLVNVAARFAASAALIIRFRRRRFERKRVLFFETPNLIQLRRDFRYEAGGALEHGLAARIVRDHQGVGDVKLVACARQGYVPEATLFVLAVGVAQAAWRGEFSVRSPYDEDRAPFESLGLVDGGERQRLVLVAAFDHVLGGQSLRRAVAF